MELIMVVKVEKFPERYILVFRQPKGKEVHVPVTMNNEAANILRNSINQPHP